MFHGVKIPSDEGGGSKLDYVALAVIERKAIAFKSLQARYGKTCRGIEATAQETDRFSG
jgi:hypothetical protein